MWFPFELWIIAMFAFIIVDGCVESFIAESFERLVLLRWVRAMSFFADRLRCVVTSESVFGRTAAGGGNASHSIYQRAHSDLSGRFDVGIDCTHCAGSLTGRSD